MHPGLALTTRCPPARCIDFSFLSKAMLVKLGESNIKTLEDFAGLTTDELIGYFEDKSDNDKTRKISELKKKGLEPKIEILVHGVDDEVTIKKIEAAIIDLIGKNTKKPTQPANSMLEMRIIKPATYLEPYLVFDSKLCICAISK